MANKNPRDQFDDLPLPGMESSWQKMKELLDKKDNRKPMAFLLRSAGLLFLLLLCGAVVWFMVKNNNNDHEKNIAQQSSSTPHRKSTTPIKNNNEVNPKSNDNQSVQNETRDTKSISKTDLPGTVTDHSTGNKTKIPGLANQQDEKTTLNYNKFTLKRARYQAPNKQSADITQGIVANDETDDLKPYGIQMIDPLQHPAPRKPLRSILRIEPLKPLKPFEQFLKPLPPRNKNRITFSAGVSLHQQIPFAGQQYSAYNYNGRKNLISDYTPSVYLRFEKNRRWFIQAEFRYAAPQAIKDFSYSRKTTLSDSFKILTTTNTYLKKTYYHQLPVSFNYYVARHLSVGGGIIYNRFYGAVSEREVATKNFNTQQDFQTKQITSIRHFNDSFFFKTQLQYLLQAEYHLNRFAFGLRLTSDLEPYIKFTRPDGGVVEKKNMTVQAMVRWRLWEAGKK